MQDYGELVDTAFPSRKYPPVNEIPGGTMIQDCLTEQYGDVRALIRDKIVNKYRNTQ